MGNLMGNMTDLTEQSTVAELCEKYGLSSRLAYNQCVDIEGIERLNSLHNQRRDLFLQAETLDLDTTNDLTTMHRLVENLEQIEFAMQRAWNFNETRDMHSWWYCIPQCECPTMDNSDPLFFGTRINTPSCKVHGNNLPQVIDG